MHDEGAVLVFAGGSSVGEQLLARGDAGLLGLVGRRGRAAWACRCSRRSAAGEPFRRGNARRFAVLAGVVLVHGVVGAAAARRGHLVGAPPHGSVRAGCSSPTARPSASLPFVVVVGLLVLAEAFRRGEQLADDVEGLV